MTIAGVGQSLAERMDKGEYTGLKGDFVYNYNEAPEGLVAVWPYTSKGKECVWRLVPERLIGDWNKGYIKISENKFETCPNQYSIQYLPEGIIGKVENGELETVGVESNGKTLVFGENSTAGAQIPTIWTRKEYYTAKGTSQIKELFNTSVQPFDYPKPLGLIGDVISLLSNDKDTILDFFSGSATTAHACFMKNFSEQNSRQWIMIQLPEETSSTSAARLQGFNTICEAAEERIRRAGNKIAEEVAEANKQPKLGEEPKKLPDIGFRVFRLDESGIAEPKDGQLLIDCRKDGRSDLDIIFEVMLKWGYELTYPIEKTEFAGYGCYSVAAGDLICCMEPGLTVDALEAIAAEQPRRVFIMDSVFGYDDSLKLDALAIFKHAEEQTQQKIELRTV